MLSNTPLGFDDVSLLKGIRDIDIHPKKSLEFPSMRLLSIITLQKIISSII